MNERAATRTAQAQGRRWVPAEDVAYYLAQGWTLIDDQGEDGECLLAPPREDAA